MLKRIAAAFAVIIMASVLVALSARVLPQVVKKEEAVKTVIFQEIK